MDIEFNLSGLQLLQLFVAVILPVIVGLVTTRITKPGKQAILLLVLSVVTALLTELLAAATAGLTYDLGAGLLLAVSTFVIGVAVHYGLWKPTGVTAKVADLGVTAKHLA